MRLSVQFAFTRTPAAHWCLGACLATCRLAPTRPGRPLVGGRRTCDLHGQYAASYCDGVAAELLAVAAGGTRISG
eukprot:6843484-Alexandrium_andersonii.AAC.1